VVAFAASDSGSGGSASESEQAIFQRRLACPTFAPDHYAVGPHAAAVTDGLGPTGLEHSPQAEAYVVGLTHQAAPTPTAAAGARRKLFQVHGGLFRRRKRKEEKPKGPPTPPFLTYTGETCHMQSL
jgi:hypothetical protein